MHNKLMVADNAAAIVGGRNIGDIYYGVNTFANAMSKVCLIVSAKLSNSDFSLSSMMSSIPCSRLSAEVGTS